MSQRQSSLGMLAHSSKAMLSWLLHILLYLTGGMLPRAARRNPGLMGLPHGLSHTPLAACRSHSRCCTSRIGR